jgi:hypothetical protein
MAFWYLAVTHLGRRNVCDPVVAGYYIPQDVAHCLHIPVWHLACDPYKIKVGTTPVNLEKMHTYAIIKENGRGLWQEIIVANSILDEPWEVIYTPHWIMMTILKVCTDAHVTHLAALFSLGH